MSYRVFRWHDGVLTIHTARVTVDGRVLAFDGCIAEGTDLEELREEVEQIKAALELPVIDKEANEREVRECLSGGRVEAQLAETQESLEKSFAAGYQAGLAGESRLSSAFKPGTPLDQEWSKGWNKGWDERLASGQKQVEPANEL
jgi:ribosome modulation factor